SALRSSTMLSTGASTDVFVSSPAGSNVLPGELTGGILKASLFKTSWLAVATSAATSREYVGLATLVMEPLLALTTGRVIFHLVPPASPSSCWSGQDVFSTETGLSLIFHDHAASDDDAAVPNVGAFCRVRMSPNRATPLFA